MVDVEGCDGEAAFTLDCAQRYSGVILMGSFLYFFCQLGGGLGGILVDCLVAEIKVHFHV
jgi:hypothetical protein